MGSIHSDCARLTEQLGWPTPKFADDFYPASLAHYLSNISLEVVLPTHAPQMDLSIGDRKQKMYPRPNFCWEAYKMHLALVGPSTACKNQMTDFLPEMSYCFRGASARLAPGREAIPYYFLDPDLHRAVLWELPEIQFKQSAEDYVREIGLLYIDCVFLLFSDKYVLTDIYCKLCVAMALHGIPFFVLCTQSSDNVDEKQMRRLQSTFMEKGVQVRMFNPRQPHSTVETLLQDFFKEVSWNRSKGANSEWQKEADEAVLGQTVRLKSLEKRAELNGRCGVCIGYQNEEQRYLVRLITDGIEIDIALKAANFSILKPKLLGQMVRIKGLQSKPELNGRYAFVDEFLRENERYRVLIPDKPGTGMALALKSENLEKVGDTNDARPVEDLPKTPQLKAPSPKPSPVATKPTASKQPTANAAPQTTPKSTRASVRKESGQAFQPAARSKPEQQPQTQLSAPQEQSYQTPTPVSRPTAIGPNSQTADPRNWKGPPTPTAQPAPDSQPAAAVSSSAQVPLKSFFHDGPSQSQATSAPGVSNPPAQENKKEGDDDLMARILAAEQAMEKKNSGETSKDRRHEALEPKVDSTMEASDTMQPAQANFQAFQVGSS